MDVLVVSPCLSFISCTFPHESTVSDLIDLFSPGKGVACLDFYVKKNGRLSGGEERLHAGAVYRLEPRLCGGKGGFGSMLRALGAQIEKTTNREACRDLSGRRLRDVNHEKEMAEWLKKQTDRDAEKEQRRLEKIQRKLAEPKRGFIDAEFDQQCHDLSERLDNSVLKGMQASSSNLVQAEDRPCRKRPAAKASAKSAAHSKKNCFWTGIEGIEDMDSTDEESDESEAEGFSSSPSSSSASSSSVAGPSNISQPVAVSTSTARDQEKFKSRDRPCSSSGSSSSGSSSSGSSSSSACSAPCSPPPSQGSREENEEDRKTDQEEEHSEMAQEEEHAETAQEKEEEHVEVAKEEEHAEAAQEKEEEHAEVAQEKEEEHAEAAQEEEEEHGETAQEEEHAEAAQEKEEEHAEAAQEKEEEHAEVAQEEERGETAQEEEHAEAAQEKEEEHGEMTQNEIENTQSVSSRRNAEKDKPVESVDPQKVQLEDADTPLDLLSVSRAEELEAVGLERLKAELMKRGMKCGGTLQERAARLFSVRGLGAGQIDPALLAKPSKGKKK